MNILTNIAIVLPALIVAVVVHEYSHGKVAELLGDPTARDGGRLTLNPLAHIDIFGSVILPLLLLLSGTGFIFGWAKPVPINPSYFKDRRKGMMYVGLAGPSTNLAIAALAGMLYRTPLLITGIFSSILYFFVFINVILAVFNLIPIPPLDGSRVLAFFIPKQFLPSYYQLEEYGMLILIVLLLFFGWIFWAAIEPIFKFFLHLFLGTGAPTL